MNLDTFMPPENPTIEQLCGWWPHPEETAKAPLVAQMAPHLMSEENAWDGKSDICLWDACIKVTGANLSAHKQTIGDCVSHGHGSGMDYLQCVQIALGKVNGSFVLDQDNCYTEAIYGQMRKRAGQLSNQDGASGIWAVESLVADGYPTRKGRVYNGSDAKKWGARGTPETLISEGKDRRLAAYVKITDTKQAMNLLNNGYPISVCSNQGFSMSRDANGVCQAQGNWGHCMCIIGGFLVSGQLIFVIMQSWGQNVPSGPTIKRMPDNSFGANENVVARMFRAGDSYALTSVPGFPANDLNFDV